MSIGFVGKGIIGKNLFPVYCNITKVFNTSILSLIKTGVQEDKYITVEVGR